MYFYITYYIEHATDNRTTSNVSYIDYTVPNCIFTALYYIEHATDNRTTSKVP